MTFPKRNRNWKRVQPHDLRDAYRLTKDYAAATKNLSVERIAELMGISADLLYKYMGNGSMPSNQIPTFEMACGIHFVSDYLAMSAGRMVIEIPTGRAASALDTNELQAATTDAIGSLMRYYQGQAEQDETLEKLTATLKNVAFHRENVMKGEQPEIDFCV